MLIDPSGYTTTVLAGDSMETYNTQTWTNNNTLPGGQPSLNILCSLFLNGPTLTFTGSGTTLISGLQDITGTTGGLVVACGGGLILNANNTSYAGNTTLAPGGLLYFNSSGAIGKGGSGSLTINGGSLGNSSGATVSNLQNNTQTWINSFAFVGPNNLNLGTGTVGLANNVTVTVNAATLTVGGAISDSGAGYGLTMAGSGILILSATNNSYGGTTIVTGGMLDVGSLYGGNTASWTASNIVVQNGATLALAVGGAGQFTSANVQILAALGTASGGFQSGSTLGLDTGGGNFTYSGVIANSNSGNNVLSLLALGPNAMTLSNSNSYSGGTTLSAGGLYLANTAALGTGALTINGGTLDNTSGGAMTLANNNPQNWNANFTFRGSNNLSMGSGTVGLGASNVSVTVNANTLTVGGAIADGGLGYGLTKAGGGTLVLTATNNNWSGPTTVSAGTLEVASLYGGSAGSLTVNNITVQSGAMLALAVGGAGQFTAGNVPDPRQPGQR